MEYDDYLIIPAMEHYEVYHDGEFVCSTDTYLEAIKEIDSTKLMEVVLS